MKENEKEVPIMLNNYQYKTLQSHQKTIRIIPMKEV